MIHKTSIISNKSFIESDVEIGPYSIDGSGQNIYPWPRQFKRRYPQNIVKQWEKEFK
tara:strand:+ start:284 stop:454 length:171 start_codon:yes stop_codon:yes gene_type:complete